MNTTSRKNKKQGECPICQTKVTKKEPYYPFCSKRCKSVDLGNWFDGRYKISRPIDQRDAEQE